MARGVEDEEEMAFATAAEVDGIHRTLDQFMKRQEEINQGFQSGIDKILHLLTSTTTQPQQPH